MTDNPPADIKANRGNRGDTCNVCGWIQTANHNDDNNAHVVFSKYFRRWLCGHCLHQLLSTLGRLKG